MDRIWLEKSDLDRAVAGQILTAPQAEALWASLSARAASKAPDPAQPKLPESKTPAGIKVAWFFGALIIISAMTWMMTLGWESFGGFGMATLAALYGGAFLLAARTLLREPGTRIAGGLLVTIAVCMTPLFVYGIERGTRLWPMSDPGSYRGFYPWISGSWFAMEAATIAVAAFALRRVRFPFLTMPLAVVLWFMSMDIAPLMFGGGSWAHMREVSLVFGLVMLLLAYAVDRGVRIDFAFWLYLFGMLAFWPSLSVMDSGSQLGKFLYALLNVALIVKSVYLRRRVFAVFGALGVAGYLGYLSYNVFKDSLLFPFALTLLGLAVIAVAVWWQRHLGEIEARMDAAMPAWVAGLRPGEHEEWR